MFNNIEYFPSVILTVNLELRHIGGVHWHFVYVTCCDARPAVLPLLGVGTTRACVTAVLPLLGVGTTRACVTAVLPLLGVGTTRACITAVLPLLGVGTTRACITPQEYTTRDRNLLMYGQERGFLAE